MHVIFWSQFIEFSLSYFSLMTLIVFLGVTLYCIYHYLTLYSIHIHFNILRKKKLYKTLWKMVKLLKMSNFTFFHIVFYAIWILKLFNSLISLVICSCFEFGTSSKKCTREWVNQRQYRSLQVFTL